MAKSNFGRGFQREFRPGTAANIFLNNLFIKQRQRERRDLLTQLRQQEEQKAQAKEERDTGFINQFLSGERPQNVQEQNAILNQTQTDPFLLDPTRREAVLGTLQGALDSDVPLSQEDKLNTLSQISPQGIPRLNAINRLLTSKQKKTVITERERVVGIDEIDGREEEIAKLKEQGITNVILKETLTDGEVTETKFGKFFKKTETKTDGNADGKGFLDHTKEFMKLLNGAEKDLQEALNNVDALTKGIPIFITDVFGNTTSVTPKLAQENLRAAQSQIMSIIQRQGSQTTQDKIGEYVSGIDETDPNFIPTVFKQLQEDFSNGVFDKNLEAFRELRAWFFAKTGFTFERLNAGR